MLLLLGLVALVSLSASGGGPAGLEQAHEALAPQWSASARVAMAGGDPGGVGSGASISAAPPGPPSGAPTGPSPGVLRGLSGGEEILEDAVGPDAGGDLWRAPRAAPTPLAAVLRRAPHGGLQLSARVLSGGVFRPPRAVGVAPGLARG